MRTRSDAPAAKATAPSGEIAALPIDKALCRSILYEALALGLRPPTEETLRRLASPDGAGALAAAAAQIDSESPLAELAAALSTGQAADTVTLGRMHERLFGHTAHGEVSPYETEYGDESLFQKPQEMSDIAGFLAAFGLRLDPAAHERIDHVSCELELLAFLTRKEAHANEIGDEEMLDRTREAERQFLKDHLARFAPALARRLERADAGGFHGRLASLLHAFIRSECARFGVVSGSEMLRLRVDSVDNTPMACGTAECPAEPDGPNAWFSSLPGSER